MGRGQLPVRTLRAGENPGQLSGIEEHPGDINGGCTYPSPTWSGCCRCGPARTIAKAAARQSKLTWGPSKSRIRRRPQRVSGVAGAAGKARLSNLDSRRTADTCVQTAAGPQDRRSGSRLAIPDMAGIDGRSRTG